MKTVLLLSIITLSYSSGFAQHWNVEPTDSGHALVLNGELATGSEVGVFAFTEGYWPIVVGVSAYSDNDSTIVLAWPDNPETEEIDGFINGQDFLFIGFDQEAGLEFEIRKILTRGLDYLTKSGLSFFVVSQGGYVGWPSHWPDERIGEINHSFLIMDSEFLQNFDEIAILTPEEVVAGSCLFHRLFDQRGQGRVGLAAWNDDPTTEEVDGFRENEEFHFLVWNHQTNQESEVIFDILRGDSVWRDFGFTKVALSLAEQAVENSPSLPSEFSLTAHPNPFNATTTIDLILPETMQTKAEVFDASGRRITSLINGCLSAGKKRFILNGSALVGGQYFLRLETPFGIQTRKLVLIK